MQEVLDCKVLVAYAPHFLEDEIAEHTPRLARETDRSIDDVLTEWHEFRRHIAFYTARSKATIDISRTDPDDTAYIDTIEEIAAQAIYTRDRDFLRANVPVILDTIEDDLQRYARSSSVQIGVMIGSSLSVGFGLQALLALSHLTLRLVQAVRRLPPASQAVIVASIAVAVAHPKSRAKLVQLWQSLNRVLTPTVWEAIVEGMHQFVEATATADTSFDAVQQAMPATKKKPLLSHARAVCLAARKPITTHESSSGRSRAATNHDPRGRKDICGANYGPTTDSLKWILVGSYAARANNMQSGCERSRNGEWLGDRAKED